MDESAGTFPHPVYAAHILRPAFDDARRLLFAPMLAANGAHLVMLAEQGIVSKKVARKILPVLLELRAQDGKQINIDPERGSLLLQIEGYISSHDYRRANDGRLAALAARIRD